MGYVEQAALARDQAFLDQVRVAMVTAAVAIEGEAVGGSDTVTYGKRQALAAAVLNNSDGYLPRFGWSVVQNAAIARGAPISIVSSTSANPTVVTTGVHGLSTGAVIVIAGHAVNTAANGAWTATVLTTTTFSIPALGNGVGGATGTVVKMPIDSDIQFQVNSVWNDVAGITIVD